MKKTSATFVFSNVYIGEDGKDKEVDIKLTVDYAQNNFSVFTGAGNKHFEFTVSSHKFRMWKAILKCIDEAIDFASKELELVSAQKPMPGEK